MEKFQELEPVERLLVVVAHPDDVDFGSAGTIANWASAGTNIAYCIVTDGDAGGFEEHIDRTEIPAIRREEQRNAAKKVGVSEVTFLGYHDGELVADTGLRKDIVRQIRRFRPDRILCQCPERNYQRIFASHPDHLAAGEATIQAAYPYARNPFAYPELLAEGLEAHSVKDVVLQASPNPNAYVDITKFVDLKIAAILEHKSQLPDPVETAKMVKSWVSSSAELVGLDTGSFAELYQLVMTS
jgi:LmbE family N-acetylglucosaminyl deacetylase